MQPLSELRCQHRGIRHSGEVPQGDCPAVASDGIPVFSESVQGGGGAGGGGGISTGGVDRRRYSLSHDTSTKSRKQGVIDRFRVSAAPVYFSSIVYCRCISPNSHVYSQASQKIIVPAVGEQSSENSATRPYRAVVSTTLPVEHPSIDLDMTSTRRRAGSLPVEAKFQAVYGY